MRNMTLRDGRIRSGLVAVALLALTAGCAVQSEMTNGWHDTTLSSNSLHNVLIVAIRKDPVRRRAWEDAFTTALTARGVKATASYRIYADASPDTDQVIDAVRARGFDAVLTSTRLPNQETSTYVPGTIRSEPVTTEDYYGRFHSRLISVQDAGYTETDTIIQVQTDVWATSAVGGRLVWSSTLRTLEAVSSNTVERAVTKYIMPEMEGQGVFPKPGR